MNLKSELLGKTFVLNYILAFSVVSTTVVVAAMVLSVFFHAVLSSVPVLHSVVVSNLTIQSATLVDYDADYVYNVCTLGRL